jgi:hypothetical protein
MGKLKGRTHFNPGGHGHRGLASHLSSDSKLGFEVVDRIVGLPNRHPILS